jgi:hypothetical protein
MKKTNDVKANLESGMYFKFKENGRYSIVYIETKYIV